MSTFQKTLEAAGLVLSAQRDELEDHLLTAQELSAKYHSSGEHKHPIFQYLDWLQARVEGDPQACVPYWDWVQAMLQRTDLDPADTRETLFD